MEIVDFNGLKLYKWVIGASTFIVNPTAGARLMNWNISMALGDVRDVIYWPEDAPMGEGFPYVYGGNPILFPFCGRSSVDGKTGEWKTPQGQVLPMPQHGFARQSDFEIVDINDFGFSAKLIQNPSTQSMYPYKYEFYVKYRFSQLGFAVELMLVNKDVVEIPWSAGNHFFFRLPWHSELKKSDYRVLIDCKKACYHRQDGSLEKTTAFKNFDAGDEAAINRIHFNLKSDEVKLGPKNGEEDIVLKTSGSVKLDKFASVVSWCESLDKPYYCVEPWMGLPNAMENGGVHYVQPNKSQSFVTEVSFG